MTLLRMQYHLLPVIRIVFFVCVLDDLGITSLRHRPPSGGQNRLLDSRRLGLYPVERNLQNLVCMKSSVLQQHCWLPIQKKEEVSE